MNPRHADMTTTIIKDAFKIQSHLMFFDTSHNSRRGVLTNIYAAFSETAAKMWAYARCLPARPGASVFIGTFLPPPHIISFTVSTHILCSLLVIKESDWPSKS
jgi:hypothetical protein